MKELENNVKKLELENDKLRDRLRELPIISADTMINEYQVCIRKHCQQQQWRIYPSPHPLRDSTPFWYYFMTSILGWPTLKFFYISKYIYYIWRGAREKKKTQIWRFFFQNLLAAQIFGHNRDLIVFCKCSENQLDRPKKTVISNCTTSFTNHESEWSSWISFSISVSMFYLNLRS